jgi:transglutaminase-like putative cysteine protease
MTARLRVMHRTGYEYDGDVATSFNEARMTPLTDAAQTTVESTIEVRPAIGLFRYRDYWGTDVAAFDLHKPHRALEVTATSVVQTHRVSVPGSTTWEHLTSAATRDSFAEWLAVTALTDPGETLTELAAQLRENRNPAGTGIACVEAVLETMEYVPGSTAVHTNALEAWEARQGVCQDFAHISLAMLRSLGIPARYVSGYLHPKPSAGIGEVVEGESHAWVEWFDGEWTGYDPTNGNPVADQHVAVARGRDYADVTPLKGVFSGAKLSSLSVTVEVTRLQ